MERIGKLLRSLASGASVDEAWERSGYGSREEASRALKTLATSLGPGGIPNPDEECAGPEIKGRTLGEGPRSIVINADGAARGNPGPASAAAVAYLPGGGILTTRALALGRTTNNEAEYRAVVLGLELALDLGAKRVRMRLDSELVVKQMTGEYRIKKPHLASLAELARSKASCFDEVVYEHVPRESNSDADRLANQVLGEEGSGEE